MGEGGGLRVDLLPGRAGNGGAASSPPPTGCEVNQQELFI